MQADIFGLHFENFLRERTMAEKGTS